MNCQEAIDVMGEAITDELSPALQPGFQEHMDECVACRTYFDQLRVTRQAVRAIPAERPPAGQLHELIRKFREEFDSRPR